MDRTNLNIDIGVNAPVCLGMVLRGGGQMVPPAHPRHAAICFVTRLPGWRSRPPPWWAMVGSLRESISSYATIYAPAASTQVVATGPQALARRGRGPGAGCALAQRQGPQAKREDFLLSLGTSRDCCARSVACCVARAGGSAGSGAALRSVAPVWRRSASDCPVSSGLLLPSSPSSAQPRARSS